MKAHPILLKHFLGYLLVVQLLLTSCVPAAQGATLNPGIQQQPSDDKLQQRTTDLAQRAGQRRTQLSISGRSADGRKLERRAQRHGAVQLRQRLSNSLALGQWRCYRLSIRR